MTDKVTEVTRRYWLNLLLTWAETRLSSPQYDECKIAFEQTDKGYTDFATAIAERNAALALLAKVQPMIMRPLWNGSSRPVVTRLPIDDEIDALLVSQSGVQE